MYNGNVSSETFAYCALVALLCTVVWYARRARRAIDLVDELDELDARIRSLERHLKLTAGRLNRLAPPREGTGAGNGEDVAEPVPRVRSRADLWREIERRRKGGS